MKRLLIAGAGGFGREILAYASRLPREARPWDEIGGFLDDNGGALANYRTSVGVVAPLRDFRPAAGDLVLLAIAEPNTKLKLAATLLGAGAELASFIHPTALIGDNVKLGRGVIICPHVCIPCDATIGDFVHVNSNSTIAHDTVLGEGSTLSGHCDVTGGARLGRGVFLGSSACILPNVTVGDFARIGAGSVVVRDVKSGVTVFGSPAKSIS